uniref:Neurotransmitter-gated ion-channel ligand-binding domain-containing protein n=1 Tax=Panagrolaimus davidi TaxID=227884 RepID=A0A914PZZ6_9BILA
MDVQTCNLIYESFNYNSQEVRMRWNPAAETPVAVTGRILLPDYNLIGIKNFIKAMPYPAGWVSFALGSHAIPARTMLLVNALLAMIFQFGNIMR